MSAAVRKLALRPRGEGETAFPDLGTLVRAVKGIQGDRMGAEERIRESEERRLMEEDRRLHPEKYIAYGAFIKEFYESRKKTAE